MLKRCKFLILLFLFFILTGCSQNSDFIIPEFKSPNTITVKIEKNTLSLEDLFIKQFKTYYNKEETDLEKCPPQEDTQQTEPVYNVLNSTETYTITKSFRQPSINKAYKQYALDIIEIIDSGITGKVTYEFDIKEGNAYLISEAINRYIDMYYDPTGSFVYIATNGEYRHNILEDGTLHMEFDIRPQMTHETIEKAAVSKEFIVQAANELNITGNKVHDLKEVHDYLCEKAEYDYTYDEALNNIYSLAAYGKTRCVGYSEAFMAICNYLGMKVQKAEGIAGRRNHMWNAIEMERMDYFIDVTWSDTSDNTYFLLTKEEISKTHTFKQF